VIISAATADHGTDVADHVVEKVEEILCSSQAESGDHEALDRPTPVALLMITSWAFPIAASSMHELLVLPNRPLQLPAKASVKTQ